MSWTDQKNRRRCELIDKQIDHGLELREYEELACLQTEMLHYRRRKAPLPNEHLRRLHAELQKRTMKRYSPNRLIRLLWARIRCNVYLMFYGMWRGECEYTAYEAHTGRLIVVAASTGRILDDSIKLTREFWSEYDM